MSRASNGTYTAPTNSWNPAIEGTAIDETDWNAILDDIETALTDSLSVSGKGKVTAHIDFDENASPGTPESNVGRFYAADVGGLTTPFWKDAAGNTYNLLLSSPGLSFTFDTSTTTSADPGAGKVRFNNATVSSVTEIAVDDADAVGNDVATFLNNVAANTYLIFTKRTGAGVAIFQATGVTNDSGFTKYAVTYTDHDGTFAAADPLSLSVGPAGPAGAAGASGLNWRGAWLTATAFSVNDGTSNGGSSYICTQAHTSGASTEPGVGGSWATYWNLLAFKGTDGAGTGDVTGQASSVDNEIALFSGTGGKTIKPATTTGVLKATSGVIAAAVSGTDYAPATSGTSVLKGNGSGGFSAAVAGTDYASLSFTTIAVSGQSNVVADSAGDTLTLAAGSNITITTDAATDTVTIAASGGGGSGSPSIPQGRLTLTTGTPVMTSNATAQTTVYYTPYAGRFVPLYDGTSWTMTDIGGELSQATTDATKSPAAGTTNSNYDLFVWNDSGTYRCTRGPAWSSDTARGTGAGTTELERVTGIYVNKIAITNGPAAQRGTYVGTIRTNGTSTVDYIFGALAAGGTAGSFGVWNMYNRVNVATMVRDSTDSWTYSTTAWRAANGSSTYRVSYVCGLAEDNVAATYQVVGNADVLGNAQASGIGVDSTTAFSGATGFYNQTGASGHFGRYEGLPGLGFHFVSAIEYRAAGTQTFLGDGGVPTYMQCGLSVSLRA